MSADTVVDLWNKSLHVVWIYTEFNPNFFNILLLYLLLAPLRREGKAVVLFLALCLSSVWLSGRCIIVDMEQFCWSEVEIHISKNFFLHHQIDPEKYVKTVKKVLEEKGKVVQAIYQFIYSSNTLSDFVIQSNFAESSYSMTRVNS